MYTRIFALPIIVFICCNCAQQGSPSGGPRDVDPPRVVECIPANYSLHFVARKIQITFDEFIVLNNVNQELVVSPPMEEKPEIKLRKKTLIIQFEEELMDSTTYTFNFGSAIKDLHEGNLLLNYEYVFSTGDVLDSLSVKGTLKYAENLTVPQDPISIMLYRDLRDSVPLTDIPMYIGRSDDSGVFSVNNLKADVYKVFVLKDGNNNFIFDLPTEEIGFLDSSLIVNAEFSRSLIENEVASVTTDSMPEPPGTVEAVLDSSETVDSVAMESDSTEVEKPDYNSIYVEMLLFTEEVETQYITNDSRDDRRRIQLVFARPLTDSFYYRFLGQEAGGMLEVIEDFATRRDSLTLWLLDSLDYKKDTLIMELNYTVKDTANQYIIQTDTLLFNFREQSTRKKKEEKKKQEKMVISTIRKGGEQNLNSNIKLDMERPLAAFQDSLIKLFHIPDSVEIPVSFTTGFDPDLPTRGWIEVKWESFSKYRLLMLPGALVSMYEENHDTLDISFRTRDIEYYGQILLTLENIHNPVIIQLLGRDVILRSMTIDQDGRYNFTHLLPGKYQIKFIHDLNSNGRWDTGNYMKNQQPEPVEFVPKVITVRSNWDHDVTMKLEK